MVQQPTERPLSAAPVEPANPESTSEYLTWLPSTCSAVSLRLFALDSAIIYRPGDQPGRETLQVTLPPCDHTPMVSNCIKTIWPGTQPYACCDAVIQHCQIAHQCTVGFAVHHAPLVAVLGRPCLWCMQAYKYIQRPSSTPMPGSKTVELHEPRASMHTTSGAPVSQGGRAKHSLFPPFPQVCFCCWSVHLHHLLLLCFNCHTLVWFCHACCPMEEFSRLHIIQDLESSNSVSTVRPPFLVLFCHFTSGHSNAKT